MGDKKFEQEITVSGRSTVRWIIQIGQIILKPAEWQDALWRFAKKHPYFIPIVILLQVGLLALFVAYKDFLRLEWWLWGGTAVLLFAATSGWYSWRLSPHSKLHLSLNLVTTSAIIGLVAYQTWRYRSPPQLPVDTLGIIIAEPGFGAFHTRTSSTRIIAEQIYTHLCLQIEGNDLGDQCIGQQTPTPIIIQKAGVLDSVAEAKTFGEDSRAKLVVWGQVLPNEAQVTIYFQILDDLEQAISPEFPVVLPVTLQTADLILNELDLNNDVALKKAIAEQTTILSEFSLGLMSYTHHNYDDAVRHMETAAAAIKGKPTSEICQTDMLPGNVALLYLYLGRAYNNSGRFDLGQPCLLYAQQLATQEPAIPLSLAIGYHSLKQLTERDVYLANALRLLNENIGQNAIAAYYDRGILHRIKGEYELAQQDFEEVLKRDKSFYIAQISLGQTAVARQAYPSAQKILESAVQQAKDSHVNPAWAYLNLAQAYEEDGQISAAKEAYQQAIEHQPDLDIMYKALADYWVRQRDKDLALVYYEKMAKISQNPGWAYGQLAALQKGMGLWEAARESYKTALSNETEDPMLYTGLAETLTKLGMNDLAQENYETAVSLSGLYYPHESYGHFLYTELADLEEAARQYEIALTFWPDDPTALQSLGLIYYQMNKSQQTSEIYLRLFCLPPVIENGSDLNEPYRVIAAQQLEHIGYTVEPDACVPEESKNDS